MSLVTGVPIVEEKEFLSRTFTGPEAAPAMSLCFAISSMRGANLSHSLSGVLAEAGHVLMLRKAPDLSPRSTRAS